MIKCILIAIITLLGVYYIMHPQGMHANKHTEGFEDTEDTEKKPKPYRCPNILIQKGNKFLLFNSKLTKVPGINPITFSSLDDYATFVEWQRSQGIRCPVLFLQHSYDTQGKPVYKIRESPFNLQGGLNDHIVGGHYNTDQSKLFDAGRDDPPYNQHGYPAYDPLDQYIGLETPLDKMFHDKSGISPNPMDTNWGGVEYTNKLVKGGYYKEDSL